MKLKIVQLCEMKTVTRIYAYYTGNKTEVYTNIVPMKIVKFMNEKDTIKITDEETYKNKRIITFQKEGE